MSLLKFLGALAVVGGGAYFYLVPRDSAPALTSAPQPFRGTASQVTSQSPPSAAPAQPTQKPDLGATLAQAKSENWPRLEDHGEGYLLLKSVRAVKAEDASRIDPKDLLGTKFGYALVIDSSASSDSFPKVVYHEQTRSLALVTGVLKVQLGTPDLKAELPAQLGVQLVQSFDHLNLAYFRAPQGQSYDQLIGTLQRVRQFPNVQQVDLEILENMAQF